MALDLSTDYKVWDNRESITYYSHATTGDTSTTITECKRRALTWKEIVGSAGVYGSQDRVWLIPVATAGSLVPKPSDRVRDGSGNDWTVLESGLNTFGTWYRLVTRNIVLSAGLRDTISLQRPSNRADLAAGRVPTFSTINAGVAARIQEQSPEVGDHLGKRSAVRKFSIYVGTRLYPMALDRVVDQNGTIYQVIGWNTPDRIEQLQELLCEVVA